jgi:c-di-GMP-binding flagellar brake protein YcgR
MAIMTEPRRERRRHKRHDLACPVSLADTAGTVLARSRSINISDGGMLFPVPGGPVPPRGAGVRVDFSIPRTTPNTRLLEERSSNGIVVREERADEASVRLAVQFDRPLDLELEV